jgi:protein involved in polysaccharide export with SLBB domain
MIWLNTNRNYHWILLLLALFSLNCAARQELSPVNNEIFQIPLYRTAAQMPEYQIGIGDELEVKFFDNEKFNEKILVRPDGRISLQRIDDLYVNGLTPTQLDSFVTRSYGQIIKNPDITIFVRKCSGDQVYLLGEVKMPGPYPLQNGMTLLQALAVARWESGVANLGSVVLLRKTNANTLIAQKINTRKLLDANHPGADLVLQADDVIYVPKKFIANLGQFVRSYYDILLPPWQAFWQIQYIEARINND